jgi:hypothetical protein
LTAFWLCHCLLFHNAATIGNWIGGAVCMATVYAFIYGKPPKQFFAWLEERKLQQLRQQQERPQQSLKAAKPKVEVRVPVTLDTDGEISFAHGKVPS